MQIANEKVVAIHYTLTDKTGKILDSSIGKEPLYYIHGMGNLIPGMERGLDGKVKGDKLSIEVAPEEGYGHRDDAHVQQVPVGAFNGATPEVGMQFQAGGQEGQFVVTVTAVDGDMVTVDANHPLAGEHLFFDVEVMDVRAATNDEIAHGHVHGPGGHHH